MQQLAALGGFEFKNDGVTTSLTNPYLSGSTLDQIRTCAEHAGINFSIEQGGVNGKLVIWPYGASRSLQVPLISPETGLVNYPSYSPYGINFTTLYNPSLRIGGLINLQSSLKPACGQWYVQAMAHSLSCQMPGGPWFTDVATSLLETEILVGLGGQQDAT